MGAGNARAAAFTWRFCDPWMAISFSFQPSWLFLLFLGLFIAVSFHHPSAKTIRSVSLFVCFPNGSFNFLPQNFLSQRLANLFGDCNSFTYYFDQSSEAGFLISILGVLCSLAIFVLDLDRHGMTLLSHQPIRFSFSVALFVWAACTLGASSSWALRFLQNCTHAHRDVHTHTIYCGCCSLDTGCLCSSNQQNVSVVFPVVFLAGLPVDKDRQGMLQYMWIDPSEASHWLLPRRRGAREYHGRRHWALQPERLQMLLQRLEPCEREKAKERVKQKASTICCEIWKSISQRLAAFLWTSLKMSVWVLWGSGQWFWIAVVERRAFFTAPLRLKWHAVMHVLTWFIAFSLQDQSPY